jgi:fructose/tagatose bisphosphate aldolase
VSESGCDWLSVAVGNIHGAIAEATRDQKKPEARLDVAHIKALQAAAGIPLVLHGGAGIQADFIRQGIKAGIAKINVGTEIRQAFEKIMQATGNDIEKARQATYEKVRGIINDMLNIKNTSALLYGGK